MDVSYNFAKYANQAREAVSQCSLLFNLYCRTFTGQVVSFFHVCILKRFTKNVNICVHANVDRI